MRRILFIFALSFSLLANAAEKPGFTISPMIGMTIFEDDVDDAGHWALGLGYQFDSPWAVELMYSDVNTELDSTGTDIDFSRWHLDGLYHTGGTETFRPYLSFGAGRDSYDVTGASSEDETLINVGAGFKYAFAENTGLRGDLKLFRGSDFDNVQAALSIGIHHVFGSAAATVAPTPKVEAPKDTDGDGVLDGADACPTTPAGVAVDYRGCAIDTDGDGVADYKDKCPNTTNRSARINADGCYVVLQEKVKVELNVEFDNNSSASRPEHRSEIERVYRFMQEYPLTKVTIEGHTDSRGAAEYNKSLSQRRANTVAQVLINDFGIAANRVTAIGYGEERPIATNETAAGRQKNRRVVGVVEAIKEKIETN